MRARRRDPQPFMSHSRGQDHHRLTDLRDKRLLRAVCEDDPINGLNIIIVVRTVQRQSLIGQQPEMGVRHRRRMPMFWIAAMDVSKRRLSEAQQQRNSRRDYRQSY